MTNSPLESLSRDSGRGRGVSQMACYLLMVIWLIYRKNKDTKSVKLKMRILFLEKINIRARNNLDEIYPQLALGILQMRD
jgi:hypothetical protein